MLKSRAKALEVFKAKIKKKKNQRDAMIVISILIGFFFVVENFLFNDPPVEFARNCGWSQNQFTDYKLTFFFLR